MQVLDFLSIVLVALVGAADIGAALLFAYDLQSGRTTGAEALVWFGLFTVVAGLLALGWRLRKRGRPGLACLVLTVGPLMSFCACILALFQVHPYAHH